MRQDHLHAYQQVGGGEGEERGQTWKVKTIMCWVLSKKYGSFGWKSIDDDNDYLIARFSNDKKW